MTILGYDWKSLGQGIFGGAHIAGKMILTAFGAGQAAQAVETLAAPALPGLAKTGGAVDTRPRAQVERPEYVAVVIKGVDAPTLVIDAAQVMVVGGKRLPGTGYRPGEGLAARKYSFGYDEPAAVEIVSTAGKKSTFSDVRQILFLGGTEGTTRVAGGGESMNRLLGDAIMGDLDLCGMTGHDYMPDDPVVESVEENTYLFGTDVLGAPVQLSSKARAGFLFQKSPQGKVVTALKLRRPKRGDHATSIKNGRDAGRRAIATGERIKAILSRPTQLVGAVSLRRKRTRLTAAQLKKMADQVIRAGRDALAKADDHEKKITAKDAKRKAAMANLARVPVSFKKMGARAMSAATLKTSARPTPKPAMGKRTAAVLGADFDLYDEEIIGDDYGLYDEEIIGAPTDPDPLNPGFLIDGTPDTGGATAYSSETSTTPASAPTEYPVPPDYGLGAPPTLAQVREEAQRLAARDPGAENDRTSYDSGGGATPVPEGAIYYDGSRGLPDWGFLSWQLAYGYKNNNKRDGAAYRNQPWWAGGVQHDAGWHEQHGDSYDTLGERGTGPVAVGSGTPAVQAYSLRSNWGPLVGHPENKAANAPWTKGLRYDAGKDAWFWYRDTAPEWASAPEDQALLNQALVDYKAAIAAEAARVGEMIAADQLAADQAAALQRQQTLDAARIANEQQVETAQLESRQMQQSQQQSEFDQQFEQQYAQQQSQYEQQQSQLQTQASQLALQQQQQALEYYRAHPEEGYAPPMAEGAAEEDGDPFAEQGGGGGYVDPYAAEAENVDWGEETAREPDSGFYEPSSKDLEEDL